MLGRFISRPMTRPKPIERAGNDHRTTIVFENIGNLTDFLRNAGKLRETLQKAAENLGNIQAEGAAGGGVVTATVNGRLELVRVRIDPKLLTDNDVELLEDLVTSAVNQALGKAREAAARSMQDSAGGLPMGGLSELLGGASGG